MRNLFNKLQKDLTKLQTTLQKEGNDLLTRIKKLDVLDNIDTRRKEIESVIVGKLSKLEPAYFNFLDEVQKNAEKAGINLKKFESEFLKRTESARKTVSAVRKSKSKTASRKKTATKKTSTAKSTTTKAKARKTAKS